MFWKKKECKKRKDIEAEAMRCSNAMIDKVLRDGFLRSKKAPRDVEGHPTDDPMGTVYQLVADAMSDGDIKGSPEKEEPKYTAEEWAEKAEKATQLKKLDKILKINEKSEAKSKRQYPLDSIIEVLGVRGFVVGYANKRNGKLESVFYDHRKESLYYKKFTEVSDTYHKESMDYINGGKRKLLPRCPSIMLDRTPSFKYFEAETQDYFPIVEFPSTGNKMTLKGDVLKQAKRIGVK